MPLDVTASIQEQQKYRETKGHLEMEKESLSSVCCQAEKVVACCRPVGLSVRIPCPHFTFLAFRVPSADLKVPDIADSKLKSVSVGLIICLKCSFRALQVIRRISTVNHCQQSSCLAAFTKETSIPPVCLLWIRSRLFKLAAASIQRA